MDKINNWQSNTAWLCHSKNIRFPKDNSAKAQLVKNISQILASTKGHHKYDHIMNIRSESDCDRGHKPSKLIHTVREHHLSFEGHKNIILPR